VPTARTEAHDEGWDPRPLSRAARPGLGHRAAGRRDRHRGRRLARVVPLSGRMNWDAFAAVAPEIAERAEARLRTNGLCLVGTLRRDGSPRISPCEIDVAAGELLLGMMWRSRKAIDLLRDPRIVVHSVTSDREGTEGDVKLYGRAIDVSAPDVR